MPHLAHFQVLSPHLILHIKATSILSLLSHTIFCPFPSHSLHKQTEKEMHNSLPLTDLKKRERETISCLVWHLNFQTRHRENFEDKIECKEINDIETSVVQTSFPCSNFEILNTAALKRGRGGEKIIMFNELG